MLIVHMFQLIWRCGNGGSWRRSVGWSTCFLVWKNMKCCRSNIAVSSSYVVVLSARHFVCGTKRALSKGKIFLLFSEREWSQLCFLSQASKLTLSPNPCQIRHVGRYRTGASPDTSHSLVLSYPSP